jgi:hypothetical protein
VPKRAKKDTSPEIDQVAVGLGRAVADDWTEQIDESSKRRRTSARAKRAAWIREVRKRQREVPKRTLAFFKALDLEAVEAALQEAHELAEERVSDRVRDEVYRIFHKSWKMYGLVRHALFAAAERARHHPTFAHLAAQPRSWVA